MAGSVQLAAGSASALLHEALAASIEAYPGSFAGVDFPRDAGAFRRHYPRILPVFEAARLASDDRIRLAQTLVDALKARLVWQPEGGDAVPIDAWLEEPGLPMKLVTSERDGPAGWQPDVTYRGERFAPSRLAALGRLLVERNVVTRAAGESLAWIEEGALTEGALHLEGRKIVVFGAAAEMAPTRHFLEAGAEVLWLDLAPPPAGLLEGRAAAGRVHWPEGGVDLLARPRDVLATVQAFADGDPVDLGLYAYAPGQARELRLTGTMNAIVDALPDDIIGSVTLLVSPTTPTGLDDDDLTAMVHRREGRPAWESAFDAMGLLGRGSGAAESHGRHSTRTVVDIQGASYQAAQYLAKLLVAEVWGNGRGLRVSANTAAITQTRSLEHPVFAAAFEGAAAFGVETFTPGQSRRVSGLLAVADWLRAESPVPGRVRVHGGIHTLPYPLESALKVAAAIGFCRRPVLLGGLVRGA